MSPSHVGEIAFVYMAKTLLCYNQGRLCETINLTLSFEGQDDPECSKQYQK